MIFNMNSATAITFSSFVSSLSAQEAQVSHDLVVGGAGMDKLLDVNLNLDYLARFRVSNEIERLDPVKNVFNETGLWPEYPFEPLQPDLYIRLSGKKASLLLASTGAISNTEAEEESVIRHHQGEYHIYKISGGSFRLPVTMDATYSPLSYLLVNNDKIPLYELAQVPACDIYSVDTDVTVELRYGGLEYTDLADTAADTMVIPGIYQCGGNGNGEGAESSRSGGSQGNQGGWIKRTFGCCVSGSTTTLDKAGELAGASGDDDPEDNQPVSYEPEYPEEPKLLDDQQKKLVALISSLREFKNSLHEMAYSVGFLPESVQGWAARYITLSESDFRANVQAVLTYLVENEAQISEFVSLFSEANARRWNMALASSRTQAEAKRWSMARTPPAIQETIRESGER